MTAIKNPGNTHKTICTHVQCFCHHCLAAQDVLHALRHLVWPNFGVGFFCYAFSDASSQQGGGGRGTPPSESHPCGMGELNATFITRLEELTVPLKFKFLGATVLYINGPCTILGSPEYTQ